jgi:hypothetical protein
MPKVEKIRGLNLPGTPTATSACRGIPLLLLDLLKDTVSTAGVTQRQMSCKDDDERHNAVVMRFKGGLSTQMTAVQKSFYRL